MDILTQGLTGGLLAQTGAGKDEVRRATIIGVLSGLAADADALIRSSQDPLLTLEYHRHFTHSLLFIPIGALLVSALLWPIFRSGLRFQKVYIYSLLGFSLSGVIDACTSYGTQLLWPLSSERFAWAIISIIDPVFSAILLIAMLVTIYTRRRSVAIVGVGLAFVYLMVGLVQHQRVEQAAQALANNRGHIVSRHLVKPTLGNLVLWRSVYIAGGRIYADGIRATTSISVYPGESVELLEAQDYRERPGAQSRLLKDIQRFSVFSAGFIAHPPGRPDVIGDMRYSLLPNAMQPVWGIEFDPGMPQQPVRFVNYRQFTPGMRETFFSMLTGDYRDTDAKMRDQSTRTPFK